MSVDLAETESQQIKHRVEHDTVPLNIGQGSKCFLVANTKTATIITHIMFCLNLFHIFS